MADYVVQQGDCINSIASDHGFFWQTLWSAPENADLKAKRASPDILQEGDSVFIPEKRSTPVPAPAGKRHPFILKGIPAMLRLQVLDPAHNPRKNLPYTLTIDGIVMTGVTDGKGMVIHSIPPNAQKGVLVVTEGKKSNQYILKLGHLNPHDDLTGVQHRLKNLGYSIPAENGQLDQTTVAALNSFQRQYNLPVTGTADAATSAKLVQLHGS